MTTLLTPERCDILIYPPPRKANIESDIFQNQEDFERRKLDVIKEEKTAVSRKLEYRTHAKAPVELMVLGI